MLVGTDTVEKSIKQRETRVLLLETKVLLLTYANPQEIHLALNQIQGYWSEMLEPVSLWKIRVHIILNYKWYMNTIKKNDRWIYNTFTSMHAGYNYMQQDSHHQNFISEEKWEIIKHSVH